MNQAIILVMEPRDLPARLETLIEESGLSQVRISERAGQRASWVASLLQGWRGRARRGSVPSLETCWLLARGLGVSLAQLLGPELLAGPAPREPPPPRGPTTIELEATQLPPTMIEPPPTPAPEPVPKGKRGK